MDKFWFLFVSVSVTCTCSVYAAGINRILNGSPATENQFPYMISLQRIGLTPSTNRGHRCGGALVTLQHAVTTASCTLDVIGNNIFVPPHCFLTQRSTQRCHYGEVVNSLGHHGLSCSRSVDCFAQHANINDIIRRATGLAHDAYVDSKIPIFLEDGVPIAPAGHRVFAGSVDLTNDTSVDRIRRIADITIHPEYDTSIIPTSRLPNDIAVIILGNPFLEGTVAYLPTASLSFTDTISCTLSGWGAQGTPATISTQLIHTQKLTVNQLVCATIFGTFSLSMLCAGAPGAGIIEGAAGCMGDEGSPLVCQGGLVGLLVDTGDCSSVSNIPQVYTRVSSYEAWINDVVAQPVPDIGPEPTQTTPTSTTPVTTTEPSPTPAPDGASASQPGVALLALIAIAQIVANAIIRT